MGFSFRKSGQGIRILIMLVWVLSLWGCNTGNESGGDTPKAGATAIAKAAADKSLINETLGNDDQNRYIKGTAGSRMIYTDAGGQDTYTILPVLCGDVEIIDNDVSTVNLPAGLNITSSRFMSDKVLFTINGFTLTLSGKPSLFNFVFAGSSLSNATGVSKTLDQTAQAFGTTVPAGSEINAGNITGQI